MRSSDWSSDVCSSDLYSLSDGRDGLRALLAAPGPQPTAVIGGNDLLAIGVMLEAQQSGLSVPDDLSVAGFDDIELAANFAPALTTVHVPVEEICALAGDYLVARIERSEERRVGKECVSTCRSRWEPYHKKKKNTEE